MNENLAIVSDCFEQCVFNFDSNELAVQEKLCMHKCAIKHDFMTAVDRKNKPKYLKNLEANTHQNFF